MKTIILAMILAVTACTPAPVGIAGNYNKANQQVKPGPFSYTDCMRLNGNPTFCKDHSKN